VLGTDGWEFLQQNPALARIFDDAMTDSSALLGPAIASAYDFGRGGSIMDVGGGNGVLLAAILKHIPDWPALWRTCRTCWSGQQSAAFWAGN
jgi:O-methyltransferase domain